MQPRAKRSGRVSRAWLGVAAMLLGAASAAHGAQKALVVGVEQYASARDLNGPKYDAENFSDVLVDVWGYERDDVRILLDEEATKETFIGNIQSWLIDKTQPGDSVVIYFSGHGVQTPDENGDETDGYDEALALHDVEIVKGGGFRNLVTDDEVQDLLARMPGRQVQLIVDSCHSGDVTRSIDGFSDLAEDKAVKTIFNPYVNATRGLGDIEAYRSEKGFIEGSKDLVVWTAAASYQTAFTDIERDRGSVFTNRFVEGITEGLADADGNGTIAVAELFDYVTAESEAFCRRNPERCRLGLKPTLEAPREHYLSSIDDPVQSGVDAGADSDASEMVEQANTTLSRFDETSVDLTMEPSADLELGETLKIKVRSNVEGYLLVLDVDPVGNVTQVFPNRYSDQDRVSNRIGQGETRIIPEPDWGFDLKAVEPVGEGTLYALVMEDDIDITALTGANKDLEVIDQPVAYLGELAARLRETWSDGQFNRAAKWAAGRENYHITR